MDREDIGCILKVLGVAALLAIVLAAFVVALPL